MAAWQVKELKQSFSRCVSLCSLYGRCFWPLKIASKMLPTPDRGMPPLALPRSELPRSIRWRRLRPPATVNRNNCGVN